MSSRFKEVINVLGLDPDRLWYYIPGFNGYEISSDRYLRSMKHYKKYPTGILIFPNKKGNVTISNDYNKRVTVNIAELIMLAHENEFNYRGYPRKTYICDMAPRNFRTFIPPEPKPVESHNMPKFTIIKDTEQEVKPCPVYDLLGRGLYYGRQEEESGRIF